MPPMTCTLKSSIPTWQMNKPLFYHPSANQGWPCLASKTRKTSDDVPPLPQGTNLAHQAPPESSLPKPCPWGSGLNIWISGRDFSFIFIYFIPSEPNGLGTEYRFCNIKTTFQTSGSPCMEFGGLQFKVKKNYISFSLTVICAMPLTFSPCVLHHIAPAVCLETAPALAAFSYWTHWPAFH